MLRKIYLVSPDNLNTVTSKNSITPPPPDRVRKAPEAEKKHTSSKRRRWSVKKIKSKKKKDTPRREHDMWVAKRSAARRDYGKFFKVRAKLHEADVERKRQIKTVADFLKQVLPPTTTSSSAQRDASHSDTLTDHGPPVKPEPPPRAIPTKRRPLAYKTPAPIPSTSRDVYETPTPQLQSIKGDVDDDDDVSTDDQQIEPDVIDYDALRVGVLASPSCPHICMNLRSEVSTQSMVSEETEMGG